MKTSQRGIDFIKEAEGLGLKAYPCSVGKLTIGYGHVLRKGESYPNGITKDKAEKLLQSDIKEAENTINRYVTVKLNQRQYDSLVSLVFNWGSGNFRKSKGLKKLNSGDYAGALKEFSEVTNNGLLKERREKEAEMWNEEAVGYKWIHTPDIKHDAQILEVTGNGVTITDKLTGRKTHLIQTAKKIDANVEINNQVTDTTTVIKKEHVELTQFDYGPTKQQVEQHNNEKQKELAQFGFDPKPPKPYRLAIIAICLIVIAFIAFSYYKASAKPLEGEYTTCFTPPERCGDLIVTNIKSAKKSIFMQAYYITSNKIISSLIEARKRGIDVQLVLDRTNLSTANKTKLKMLSEAGIIMYQDKVPGIAHNKVIIIDNTTVITGSFNFTESADTRNAENIIIITNSEVAKDYLKNWENRDKVEIK